MLKPVNLNSETEHLRNPCLTCRRRTRSKKSSRICLMCDRPQRYADRIRGSTFGMSANTGSQELSSAIHAGISDYANPVSNWPEL